jgi:hypothetical protein
MKKVFNTEKNEEIISLNTDLYDDFFVQELESRLETDPLTLGGLLELFGDCNDYYSCTGHCNDSAGGCSNMCEERTSCTQMGCAELHF